MYQEPPTLHRFEVPEGVYEQQYNPVTQKMEAVLSEIGKRWTAEEHYLIKRIIDEEEE